MKIRLKVMILGMLGVGLSSTLWGVPVLSIPGASPASTASNTSGTSGANAFYGIETKITKRMIFVVDVSGSMEADAGDGRTRIAVLRNELMSTLRGVAATANRIDAPNEIGTFRIMAFSTGIQLFPEKGSTGLRDRVALSEAEGFVRNLGADGMTNMRMAWERIMGMVERDEIDTVYFLSDGDPTDCNGEQLKQLLKSLSEKVTVHCIAIGQESPLLRDIANSHHGTYVERK